MVFTKQFKISICEVNRLKVVVGVFLIQKNLFSTRKIETSTQILSRWGAVCLVQYPHAMQNAARIPLHAQPRGLRYGPFIIIEYVENEKDKEASRLPRT